MKFATSLVLASAVSLATAHGFVKRITIDGKSYGGPEPGSDDNSPSIIRKIQDTNPVKDPSSAEITCGRNAQKAQLSAPVRPGSQLQLFWDGGDGTPWPHEAGPILNYMANCNGDCANFDPATANFFKISEQGRPGGENGPWFLANLLTGAPANLTIPNDLAPGNYILRHELLALHLAEKEGGAEYYPSCSQVTVQGKGSNAAPTPTAKFPGAYSPTDPGILNKHVFDDGFQYKFPGPPVAQFATQGGIGSSNSTSSVPAPRPAPTQPSQPSGPGNQSGNGNGRGGDPDSEENSRRSCRLKKAEGKSHDKRDGQDHVTPRMRRVAKKRSSEFTPPTQN
ncbi:glycoside hydrolase family 61 protein [Botryobasidium botryosum FD-172 SS1]|uniref:lytic cellulose monooxygenase (C4-dehydrogenating) n=1 Tax=Botryobasidium botryosum (strain FD-172 SS1) TaxID=930990 RepID=A0A067MGW7_BOTB1|nr:glycoside hydrolase family 61 protein [Botryobasidium botryosum FD-172 SS1]